MDDYILTPIGPCSVCGARYVEDPTRDGMGRQFPEEDLFERDWHPRCESCQQQAFGEAVEQDILEMIEHRLGLTAEDKETLKALVTIVGNQDRALMVARAMDRVDALERRLEDKTASLENKSWRTSSITWTRASGLPHGLRTSPSSCAAHSSA